MLKARPPVRLLLLLSLGLNVMLGAFAARVALEPPHPPVPLLLFQRMAADLPDADAEILRTVVADHRTRLAALGRPPTNAHVAIAEALRAEPFDPAALDAALTNLHAGFENSHAAIGDVLVEAATRMSPEGRAALATFRPDGGRR